MVLKNGDSQKIIKEGSKLQRWMSSRISRKERIRNVTIRQQIGLQETIIKETEQNQLTWYGRPCSKNGRRRLPKIALKCMPKQRRARGRPKKNWIEGIRKAMNKRNLTEGQWEDRKQWSLGVGQHRKTFWNGYTYTYFILDLMFVHQRFPEGVFKWQYLIMAVIKVKPCCTKWHVIIDTEFYIIHSVHCNSVSTVLTNKHTQMSLGSQ